MRVPCVIPSSSLSPWLSFFIPSMTHMRARAPGFCRPSSAFTHTRAPHRDLGSSGPSGKVVAEQSARKDDHPIGLVVQDHSSIAVDSSQLLMLYPVCCAADCIKPQIGGPLCREQLWAWCAPVNDSGDPFVLVGYFQYSKDRRTAGKSAWTDHYH